MEDIVTNVGRRDMQCCIHSRSLDGEKTLVVEDIVTNVGRRDIQCCIHSRSLDGENTLVVEDIVSNVGRRDMQCCIHSGSLDGENTLVVEDIVTFTNIGRSMKSESILIASKVFTREAEGSPCSRQSDQFYLKITMKIVFKTR